MNKFIIATALAAALALPAAGQTSTANGQINPSTAPRMKISVAEPLQRSVKVSGDSAFALARQHAYGGEVSSGELKNDDGRLLYSIKVLGKNKGASTVKIDAMTGEVLEAERHGGLKANAIHHKENKKLLDAKRDSAAKNP